MSQFVSKDRDTADRVKKTLTSRAKASRQMRGNGDDRSRCDRSHFDPRDLRFFVAGLTAALRTFLSSCRVDPRPYQSRIIESAISMFAGSFPDRAGETSPAASSVLIESPTGSGKTVMGLAIAALLQRWTGARVGWVAMRRNPLAQAAAEDLARRFGVRMAMISMFDREPPKVDLLIVDQAQHDAATSMANLHGHIQPTWTLGLSAMPYRTDRLKPCFDQVIRNAGIVSLIQDGFPSTYHHYTIPEHTPQCVAKLLIDEPDRWGQSLVFFHRRDQCDLAYLLLMQAGIPCTVLTAQSNREKQINDFLSGRVQILINMSILTEGFDCPELKTVFCRPGGKACTIQMAGRVLRQREQSPIKQVVQCRQTPYPLPRLAMAAEQYLWTDRGWRSICVTRRLNELTSIARRRAAQADVQLPNMVAIHRPRKADAWYAPTE